MLGRTLPAALLAGAALAAAPAVAAAPADGTYKGRTSQNKSVSVKTKGGDIDLFSVKVKNNCGATNKPIDVGTTSDIPVKATGKFSVKLGPNGEFTLSGRFTGRKVTGQFRERYQDPLLGNCDTKTVTFSAQR